MAYKDFDGLSINAGQEQGAEPAHNASHTLHADSADTLELPDTSYIRDADLQRDGADLVLDGPQGTMTIEGYFSADQTPDLTAPDGQTLTPELVNSFVSSPAQYAQNMSINDASPIGAVQEMGGEATITRMDGAVEPLSMGMPVYQGDIIETAGNGAVNIIFSDDSSFAVSADTRLAIDEYVFDPVTEEGAQNFSVLKGMFVFTSGLVGRDDPDDVQIDTPSGSIGIRGTIIAGDVDHGEITVVEGAIVLRDLNGHEMTLANQFETGKFTGQGSNIENMGQLAPSEVSDKFSSIAHVAPTLFSSINDAANDAADTEPTSKAPDQKAGNQQETEQAKAAGSVDQDADNQVDGTLEGDGTDETEEGAESGDQGSRDDTEVGDISLEEDVRQETLDMQEPSLADKLEAGGRTAKMQAIKAHMQTVSAEGDQESVTAANNDTADTPDAPAAVETSEEGATQESGSTDTNNPPPPAGNNDPQLLRFSSGDVINQSGQDWAGTIGHDTSVQIGTVGSGAHNNQIAFLSGHDQIDLKNGADNTLTLGAGDDLIVIRSNANNHGNVIYGQDGSDHFVLKNGLNKLHGGTGDDTFKIDMNLGTTVNDMSLSSGGQGIDGGAHNDTVVFEGTGSIDFANVDQNYLKNIEKIDLTAGTASLENMDVNDIISMTDASNMLWIKGDGADAVDVSGFGFSAPAGTQTEAGVTYDLYTDGTVTLLVDQNIGTVAIA